MMPRAKRAVSRTDDSATISPRQPYRKKAIPNGVRREVARRYGAAVGTTIQVSCAYCPAQIKIEWSATYPLWPWFWGEFDHIIPEFHGGPTTAGNLVLACQPCNRRKGTKAAPAPAPRLTR